MGCRAWMLEVDLLDDAELLVGDHESEHHDHADQDEEGEQHAGQVADDPDTVSSECYHNLITASSQYHHSVITISSQYHHPAFTITENPSTMLGPSPG